MVDYIDNTYDIPDRLKEDMSPSDEDRYAFGGLFDCRQYHHDQTGLFPRRAPDMWFKNVSRDIEPNAKAEDYEIVDNENAAAAKYVQRMTNNRNGPGNVWKQGCRHYVKGALYQNIADRFHILEMDQPAKRDVGNGKQEWFCTKYRLQVQCFNKHGHVITTTFVDCSHTPLGEVCHGASRGFAQKLNENTTAMAPSANDTRPGHNPGGMAAGGARNYSGKLIAYRNTPETIKPVCKSASTYFSRYGFAKWMNNLRKRVLDSGGNSENLNMMGSNYPFCSLVVTTANYGNEGHIDFNDNSQGITIWHETKPAPSKQRNKFVKNWYFIFPDMDILIDGVWIRGVAIPLQHGTVVTWDARLIRHATAFPSFYDPFTHWGCGTYFGIQNQVAQKLLEESGKKKCFKRFTKAERKANSKKAKAKAASLKAPPPHADSITSTITPNITASAVCKNDEQWL